MNTFYYNTLELIDAMFISDSTQGADLASNFTRCPGVPPPGYRAFSQPLPGFYPKLGSNTYAGNPKVLN